MTGGEELRRRWRSLDAKQLDLAQELTRRATALLERHGDLTIGEALEWASDALQRAVQAPIREPEAELAAVPVPVVEPVPATVEELPDPVAVPAVEARPAGWGKGGTHCLYGHLYDEANTYWAHDGGRRCRACKRAHALGRLDRPAVREAARKYNRERGRAIRAGTWVYVRDRAPARTAPSTPDQ